TLRASRPRCGPGGPRCGAPASVITRPPSPSTPKTRTATASSWSRSSRSVEAGPYPGAAPGAGVGGRPRGAARLGPGRRGERVAEERGRVAGRQDGEGGGASGGGAGGTGRPYRGVFPIVPTVFDEDGDLDLEGQKRSVDYLIDAGS